MPYNSIMYAALLILDLNNMQTWAKLQMNIHPRGMAEIAFFSTPRA